ncbi:unnamed protein product [Vitrella brassicaformis CCMP3155]|uniref:ABC transporter domain-containing protein n=1 Tax=Vitrella brassicaformis (strain CCMP3155) TaxID=1169540 RepID=A0A0G4FDR8_VITBC|nr:unnamed protein product [Vitrella brassicaformis CCMP3155]|eukprot:CEM11345.1 unnamed protein product [Vitrella brassicaformis CCMP3155]
MATKRPAEQRPLYAPEETWRRDCLSRAGSKYHVVKGGSALCSRLYYTLTYWCFCFVRPLLDEVRTRPLTADVLPPPPKEMKCHRNARDLRESRSRDQGLMSTLLVLRRWPLVNLTLWAALHRACLTSLPFLLSLSLQNDDPTDAMSMGGVGQGCLLFLAMSLLATFSNGVYLHLGHREALRAKGALAGMVFDEALRQPLSYTKTPDSDKLKDEGTLDVLNLISSDCEKVGMALFQLPTIGLVPLQMGVLIVALAYQIGWGVVGGLGVLVLLFVAIGTVLTVGIKVSKRGQRFADERLRRMEEILQNILAIKIHAWEGGFVKLLDQLREKEIWCLVYARVLYSILLWSFTMTPPLVTLAATGMYVLTGRDLTIVRAMSALALFKALQLPLLNLPEAIQALSTGIAACKRIEAYSRQAAPARALPSRPSQSDSPAPQQQQQQQAAPKDTPIVCIDNVSFTRSSTSLSSMPSFSTRAGTERGDYTAANVAAAAAAAAPDVCLWDVGVHVGRGALVGVVGPVGSGKSTLLQAMLDELTPMGEQTSPPILAPHTAYLPQPPWLQSASLQTNILCGRPLQTAFYESVLDACCLVPDLERLPDGDQTRVGRKGVTLSGGQQQRVALAQAVYSKAEVVLMDDPFSALDLDVARAIWSRCVKGLLSDRTRIFVTQQLWMLNQCDHVIVMDQGRIVSQGPYTQVATSTVFQALLGASSSSSTSPPLPITDPSMAAPTHTASALSLPFTDQPATPTALSTSSLRQRAAATPTPQHGSTEEPSLRISVRTDDQDRDDETDTSTAGGDGDDGDNERERERDYDLCGVERGDEGKEARVVESYVPHLRVMGGFGVWGSVIVLGVLAQAALVASDYFLAIWSHQEQTSDSVTAFHPFQAYGWCILLAGLMMTFRALAFAYGCRLASTFYHHHLSRVITGAKMAFFDHTPSGRILSRFCTDLGHVDGGIPHMLEALSLLVFTILGNLFGVAFVAPSFLAAIVVAAALFWRIKNVCYRGACQLQRLDASSRAPILTLVEEAFQGRVCIRAMGKGGMQWFTQRFSRAVDLNLAAHYHLRTVFRWAVLRLETTNAMLTSLAVFALYATTAGWTSGLQQIDGTSGVHDSALFGVGLNWAIASAGYVGFLVFVVTDLESKMTSVDRIKDYIDNVPTEPSEAPSHPPDAWPDLGQISYQDLTVAYKSKSDDDDHHHQQGPGGEGEGGVCVALRNVTVDVAGGSRVGLVGRTGSGKTSLVMALYRLYDEATQGQITLDNYPLHSIPLARLRASLALLPQHAALFNHTLRFNLDPCGRASDDELVGIIKRLGLGRLELLGSADGRSATAMLDATIEPQGGNLSGGERQWVALGRLLIEAQRARIIILDEPTSPLDSGTEAMMVALIREVAVGRTLLVISHRPDTVQALCERRIKLQDGVIVEDDAQQQHEGEGGGAAEINADL